MTVPNLFFDQFALTIIATENDPLVVVGGLLDEDRLCVLLPTDSTRTVVWADSMRRALSHGGGGGGNGSNGNTRNIREYIRYID
jgi:hypothetical protein